MPAPPHRWSVGGRCWSLCTLTKGHCADAAHPLPPGLRVDDIVRAGAVVADMRKIIRQDPRIIQKLHRRVFLDKITRDQVSIYISCYVEAPNRDAFMAVKQDLLLAFIDCVERNGAKLARNRLQVLFPYLSQAWPELCARHAAQQLTFLLCITTLPDYNLHTLSMAVNDWLQASLASSRLCWPCSVVVDQPCSHA